MSNSVGPWGFWRSDAADFEGRTVDGPLFNAKFCMHREMRKDKVVICTLGNVDVGRLGHGLRNDSVYEQTAKQRLCQSRA